MDMKFVTQYKYYKNLAGNLCMLVSNTKREYTLFSELGTYYTIQAHIFLRYTPIALTEKPSITFDALYKLAYDRQYLSEEDLLYGPNYNRTNNTGPWEDLIPQLEERKQQLEERKQQLEEELLLIITI